MNELELAIIQVVLKWCHIINERIKNKWDGLSLIQGEKHVHEPTISVIGETIIAELSYSGAGAFISEFGMGSLMEKTYGENPYLWNYESSNQWNPYRTGYSIRGRAAGEYLDLDGNPHVSSGRMQGLNLEKDGYIKPLAPMHVIKHEVELAIPEINADIQETINLVFQKMFVANVKIYV